MNKNTRKKEFYTIEFCSPSIPKWNGSDANNRKRELKQMPRKFIIAEIMWLRACVYVHFLLVLIFHFIFEIL